MEVKPGYKQTEVGVIPEDWEVTQVGQAFDICNNLRMPISQAVREKMTGSFPYYGPTGIQGYINEYRVDGEYALIGEDGDHFLKWQDQSMTQLIRGRFNVNNHAHLIRGTKNLTAWFYYYFSNRDLTQYLTRQGAGRYKLTKSALLEIPCAIPPTKAEQEAIADALSDADALIESLEQLIVKKRQLKQATMQELLTGKKRLPGFNGAWEVKRLGEIADLKNGYAFKSETYTSLGFFSVVTIANVQAGYMDVTECNKINVLPRDLQPHHRLLIGDLLISMTGNVGRVCRVTVNNCLLNQRVGKLVPSLVESSFLYPLLNQRSFLTAMGSKAKGGAQGNLSVSDILEYEFLIPTQNIEQTAIAAILSDMDTEIAALERKRDKTRLLKQGMMQELLTGRIRLV